MTFSDWLKHENNDRVNENIIADFDQLVKDEEVNLDDLKEICEENEPKLNFLRKIDFNEGKSLMNLPAEIKKDYMIRKIGVKRYAKFYVHRRIIIAYVSFISPEFGALMRSIFDRYTRGDTKLVPEIVQAKNRRTGRLIDIAYKSNCIDDMKNSVMEDLVKSGQLVERSTQATVFDTKSIQVLEKIFEKYTMAIINEKRNAVNFLVERQDSIIEQLNKARADVKTASEEQKENLKAVAEEQKESMAQVNKEQEKVAKKIKSAIIEKEKTIRVDLKSRRCLYCYRIHANNSASTKHLSCCSEQTFANKRLIIDGGRLMQLTKIIQKKDWHSGWEIKEMHESEFETYVEIQIDRKSYKRKKSKSKKTVKKYDFSDPKQRFALFKQYQTGYYLNILSWVTPASREFMQNNKEFFTFWDEQTMRNDSDDEDEEPSYDFEPATSQSSRT